MITYFKQKLHYSLHYCINYQKHEMQNNKTANISTARLLGYRVLNVDWLNPFDECPLVSLSKNVISLPFSLFCSLCVHLYVVLITLQQNSPS